MKHLLKITLASFVLIGAGSAALADHGHKKDDHEHHDMKKDEGTGLGVLNSINAEASTVNLSHEPMPELGWPEMTMELPVSRRVDLTSFAAGDKVQFTLKKGRDDVFRIMIICKTDKDKVVKDLCKTSSEDGHSHH